MKAWLISLVIGELHTCSLKFQQTATAGVELRFLMNGDLLPSGLKLC